MNNAKIILLGIVSIAALFLLFFNGSMTGRYFEEIYEPFDVYPEEPQQAAVNDPILPTILFATNHSLEYVPSKEWLTPQMVYFQVNKIPIPEVNYYHYMSIRKSDIHTYSGLIGHYSYDPSEYIRVYLCTYAYKISRQAIGCERMQTGYSNGVLSFARGYTPERYIASRAAGTDFGAYYIVVSPDYGILARSPVAFLRWVGENPPKLW
jgi:hypothetical protein